MHRLLRPKNINRIVVFMALIAPILYLFGTQFAALAGAHGEDIIKENQEIVLNTREVDYNQRLATSNYSYSLRGISYVRQGGVWTANGTSTGFASVTIGTSSLKAGHTYYFASNLSSYNAFEYQIYLVYSGSTVYQVTNRLFSVSAASSFQANFVVYNNYTCDNLQFNSYLFDLTQMYGENASVDDLTRDYDIAGYNEYSLSRIDYFDEYGVPDYRQSLFLDMFGRSNFLTEWGKDALRGDRHGFYPIGQFFSYIDDYAFHLGETNIGLMGYGYAYYAAHVLLFDLLVYFATFFVRFIKDVVDRLEVSR